MKHTLAVFAAVFAIAACSEPSPPPVAKKADPTPPPAPVAKAPEAPPPPKVEEPKPDPNKELADRVKRALTDDAKIQAAGIDVTANDGTVTLWGTAATAAEKNRAAQAARKVDGVKAVENKIAVVKGS